MPPKLVALIAAAAFTTGWLLASIVSPPVAELQELPRREREAPPPRPDPAPVTSFAEQLQLKLRAAPSPPVPRRNPFVFGRTEAEDAAPRDAALPDRPMEAAPAVPTAPALQLAGIGSSKTDEGMVHTAVISDGHTVHLVKVGESVLGYTVTAITDESVAIVDAAGTERVLRFK
jgi:hypothetical protein